MAINVASVQDAVYTTIASDSVLVSSGFSVDLNRNLNSETGRQPWVGVYGPRIVSDPHTINITEPWLHSYEIMVFVQEADAYGGTEAENRLALAVDQVWTAINSNRTLNGTVDIVKRLTVEPFERDEAEQGIIATDLILIEAEKRG